MKIRYFAETDTLYMEFRERGDVLAITFEHASKRTDVRHLTVEGIAA